MLNATRRIALWLWDRFLLLVTATVAAGIGAAILTSGWFYGFDDGEVKRSWCIQAPGFTEYLDLSAEPPVKRYVFELRCRYRVSPWFPTEDQMPMTHISPNDADPKSLVYAAEVWCIKQGLTVPLESKHPLMYQGMIDDFCESDDYAKWEAK